MNLVIILVITLQGCVAPPPIPPSGLGFWLEPNSPPGEWDAPTPPPGVWEEYGTAFHHYKTVLGSYTDHQLETIKEKPVPGQPGSPGPVYFNGKLLIHIIVAILGLKSWPKSA